MLKFLSEELNILLIVKGVLIGDLFSSVNRNYYPSFSYLKEKGFIENYADKIICLYKDEYFGIIHDVNGRDTLGRGTLLILKNNIYTDYDRVEFKFTDYRIDIVEE
jgi:replicative DNA helicase